MPTCIFTLAARQQMFVVGHDAIRVLKLPFCGYRIRRCIADAGVSLLLAQRLAGGTRKTEEKDSKSHDFHKLCTTKRDLKVEDAVNRASGGTISKRKNSRVFLFSKVYLNCVFCV